MKGGEVELILGRSMKSLRSWFGKKSRKYEQLSFNDQLALVRASLESDYEGLKKIKYASSFGWFIPNTTVSNYGGTLVAQDGERKETYLGDLVYEYEKSSKTGVFHSRDDKTRLLDVSGKSDWLGNDQMRKQFLELLTGYNGTTQGLEEEIQINLIERTFTHDRIMVPAIKLIDGNPTIDFLPGDYRNPKSKLYSLGRMVQPDSITVNLFLNYGI